MGPEPFPRDALETGWLEAAELFAPLQENGVAVLGDEVVVVGGFDDTLQAVRRVEAYRPEDLRWRSLPDLPEPLHHANVAALDGVLYVLGFSVGFDFTARPRSLAFTEDGGWRDVEPMPIARARGASGVGVMGGRLVVVGGLANGAAVDLVDAYDPAADTWEALPSLPEARDHGAVCLGDGVLAYVGGRSASIASVSDAVFRFDGDAWVEGAPMLTARGGFAAASTGGECWTMGGEGNAEVDSGVFDDVEVYDVAGDRWTVEEALPVPVHGTGAAWLGGELYLPGGADTDGFGPVDTLQKYRR